jgi:hypothetical protein
MAMSVMDRPAAPLGDALSSCEHCGEPVTLAPRDLQPGNRHVLIRCSSAAPDVIGCRDVHDAVEPSPLPPLLFSFHAGS